MRSAVDWDTETIEALYARSRQATAAAQKLRHDIASARPTRSPLSDLGEDGMQPPPIIILREGLSESYPALPDSVGAARDAAHRFAAEAGLDPDRLDRLRLTVSEAVTNVVRHAYPSGDGLVEITAGLVSGEVWVLVSDTGCGHQTRSRNPGLGFGLGIIGHESDDFVVTERAHGGTEVRMRFLLEETAGAGEIDSGH